MDEPQAEQLVETLDHCGAYVCMYVCGAPRAAGGGLMKERPTGSGYPTGYARLRDGAGGSPAAATGPMQELVA